MLLAGNKLQNDPPAFASSPITEVNDSDVYLYPVLVSDPNGDPLSLSVKSGPSWLSLQTLGEVTPGFDLSGGSFTQDSEGNTYFARGYQIMKRDVSGNISFVAGQDEIGSEDGTGTNASFYGITDMTIGPDGNIYAVDSRNGLIRKVTPAGVVTTYAGKRSSGWTENVNGPALEATFIWPTGLVFDSNGNLFITDSRNHLIRKIDVTGNVTTLAGKLDLQYINRGSGPRPFDADGGSSNGSGTNARFDYPYKIAVDGNDNLYVTDRYNDMVRKVTPAGLVTTLAGSSQGFQDGRGSSALFSTLNGIAVDSQNRVFVGDGSIRMILPNGTVTTVAGGEASGFQDGFGTKALLNSVDFMRFDANGDLIFMDTSNEKMRKMTLKENVLSGDASGQAGTVGIVLEVTDGSHMVEQGFDLTVSDATKPVFTSAQTTSFEENATGLVHTFLASDVYQVTYSLINSQDASLFSLSGNQLFFKVSPDFENPSDADRNNIFLLEVEASDGTNTTVQEFSVTITDISDTPLVFSSSASVNVAENVSGAFYTASATSIGDGAEMQYELSRAFDSNLFQISATSGQLSFFSSPDFETPLDDDADNTYRVEIRASDGTSIGSLVVDITVTNVVESLSFDSNPVTSVTNLEFYNYEVVTSADVPSSQITVTAPTIPEWLSLTTESKAFVSSFAGNGTYGDQEGTGTDARFRTPVDLVFDRQGNLYVLDEGAHSLKRISPTGEVTRIAGSGSFGSSDGTGTDARFGSPKGIDIDAEGSFYVADFGINLLRKVTPGGVVTTFAGSPNLGYSDGLGTQAGFERPIDVLVARTGIIYVLDQDEPRIRKVTPEGLVSTFAGSGNDGYADGIGILSSFDSPSGFVLDEDGNLFIADTGNNRIRKITPAGVVSTFAGNDLRQTTDGQGTGASFYSPSDITVDHDGNFYVTESTGQSVRKITPDGTVTTIAGGGYGYTDGPGELARFKYPSGIIHDQKGALYVADRSGYTVRKIELLTGPRIEGDPLNAVGEHEVLLRAELGNGTTEEQSFRITVVDVTKPVYLNGDNRTFNENGSETAFVVVASDNDEVTYEVTSLYDANLFNFDSATGYLTFKSPPNYEDPQDGDGDNTYIVQTIATDASGNASQRDVSIRVNDVYEAPPVFTSGSFTNFDEGGVGTAYTARTSAHVNASVHYTLDDSKDGPVFSIDRATGEVVFNTLPDFDNPLDADADNVYEIRIVAHDDNNNTQMRDVKITVVELDDTLPVFTSSTAVDFEENNNGTAYTAVATDASPVTYSLGTGNDEALFYISGGLVAFKVAPDFENPEDEDFNNIYVIEVRANDGNNTAKQTVAITITNQIEVSKFTTTPLTSVNDNEIYNYPLSAEDADGDPLTITATTIPGWLSLETYEAVVTTLAGNGSNGSSDGTGTEASFYFPSDVAVDGNSNVYVADRFNQILRKITPEGVVTTMAGSGTSGSADGTGTNAQFSSLIGVAVDALGNVYATNASNNHSIRKIDPNGVVTTLAGSGVVGSADGTGSNASFNGPIDLIVDDENNLFVVDESNHRIRKITPEGVVSTVAGNVEGFADGSGTNASFSFPSSIVMDGSGNLYVTDRGNASIRKISPEGEVTTFAGNFPGYANGTLIDVRGIVLDKSGNFYVSGSFGGIKKIDANGVITHFAGSGTAGFKDGDGTEAAFTGNGGLAIDANDVLYFADNFNHAIRKIAITETRLRGDPVGEVGDHAVLLQATDGNGNTVEQGFTVTVNDVTNPVFTSATSVDFSENGTGVVYTASATDTNSETELHFNVTDTRDAALFNFNEFTKEVTFKSPPDFQNPLSTSGSNDYKIEVAVRDDSFNEITEVVTISVTDQSEPPVFDTSPITMANDNDVYSYTMVTSSQPRANVVVTAAVKPSWLNLVQADEGEIITLAGSTSGLVNDFGTNAQFGQAGSIAVAPDGNIYVADWRWNVIRKVTPEGLVSTFAGNRIKASTDGDLENASFSAPTGITVDKEGNFYVVDNGTATIRKISAGQVSTIAGSGVHGDVDGTGTNASFNYPQRVAVDPFGNLFILDTENNKIKRMNPEGVVTTLAGSGSEGSADGTGTNASFRILNAIAVDQHSNVYVAGQNSVIRAITPEGVVTTIAGTGVWGHQDGAGTQARFSNPSGLAVDRHGDIYVADFGNNRIRKVDGNGFVTTVAGSGSGSSVDGTDGSFDRPNGLDFDQFGNIYVFDWGSTKLRKTLAPVYILEGDAEDHVGTHDVSLRARDAKGIESTQSFQVTIVDASPPVFSSEVLLNVKENTTGVVYTALATDSNSKASITYSLGSALDENLFSIDNNLISFKATPDFDVPRDANRDNRYLVEVIASDGKNTASQIVFIKILRDPLEGGGQNSSPVFDSEPVLAIKDEALYSYPISVNDIDGDLVDLRADVLPSWLSLKKDAQFEVSTLAGNGDSGRLNGIGTNATFVDPQDVVIDSQGNIFVADGVGSVIRKIAPDGTVSTFAGGYWSGHLDGQGTEARFARPVSLAIDGVDNLYVADNGSYNGQGVRQNSAIRKISPTGEVTTIAGGQISGDVDGMGTDARFMGPNAIAFDLQGNLYIADGTKIKRMTPDGNVSTFAGSDYGSVDGTGTNAQFRGISGMTVGIDGNLYLVGGANSIRKMTTEGVVSNFIGGAAGFKNGTGTEVRFTGLSGIEADLFGNLYVSEENRRIRRVTRDLVVTTVAGDTELGYKDGLGTNASFYTPRGIAVRRNGKLVISDSQNRRIRLINPKNVLSGDPKGQIGVHQVVLTALDEKGGEATQSFTIDVLETPKFASPTSQSFAENGTGVAYTAVANMSDPNAEIAYGLGAQADERWFTINPETGTLMFKTPPDYERPLNRDLNNEYILELTASSGGASVSLMLTLRVTNLSDEAPVFESSPVTKIFSGDNYTYDIRVSDTSGDAIVVEATNKPSWLTLNQTPGGRITTFAGSGKSAFNNGKGEEASFYFPNHIVIDKRNGNMYVADVANYRIRRIDTKGNVESFVGSGFGYRQDGSGAEASFRNISSMTIDNRGNLYVTSTIWVRKITPDGIVTTLAGNGTQDFKDGTGTDASFFHADGIVADSERNLYVTDGGNNRIRKISQDGVVTTFAGNGEYGRLDGTGTEASFSTPGSLTIDGDNNLFLVEFGQYKIRKITPQGVVTTVAGNNNRASVDGRGTLASFKRPLELQFDKNGILYISDEGKIRMLTPEGDVTTYTGAFEDGVGPVEEIGVTSMAFDNSGNLYVADGLNHRIRKISGPGMTLSGNSTGYTGLQAVSLMATDSNGDISRQEFNIDVSPTSVPVIYSDPVTAIDEGESYYYRIETKHAQNKAVTVTGVNLPSWLNITGSDEGLVTSIAGAGFYGLTDGVALPDGTNTTARFTAINGLDTDDEGNIYIASYGAQRIRKLSKEGIVSTLAGNTAGDSDGTGTEASFNAPGRLALDREGNVYVADQGNYKVRKIDKNGVVSTLAGSGSNEIVDGTGTNASFGYIGGIAVDDEGNVYVSQTVHYLIRKITPDGIVSTFAGTGNLGITNGDLNTATFRRPTAIEFDNNGNLYVCDETRIRKISTDGLVSTFVGSSSYGHKDGTGTEAVFNLPSDFSFDSHGNLYLVDDQSYRVRKVTPEGVVSTVAGSGQYGYADGIGTNVSFKAPGAITIDGDDHIFIGDNSYRLRKLEFPIVSLTGNSTDQAGSHNVILKAEDADGASDLQEFTLIVRDITPPVFTSGTAVDFAEHGTGTAYTVVATHANSITYSLGTGNDESLFAINEGLVTFKTAPDFENPEDGDTNNTYVINVIASNGLNSVNQDVTITVTDVQEDVTAPDKPVITGISDDTGSSNSDGITSDRNLLIHGTAEAGASVDVFSPGGKIGTVQADANGDWMLDISRFSLPQFTVDMTAEAYDLAGNRSTVSDPFTLTIDFTAPAKPAITRISDDTGSGATDGVTSDRNIFVYGTAEPRANVDVFSPGGKIGTAQADANGDWMLDISRFNLPQFTVDMTAEAFDRAGNRSAASDPFTLTIDFTAPAKPAITRISDDTGSSATDGVTSDRNIMVHGTAESGANVDVFSPGGKIGTVQADSNGDWMLDISRFSLPQFTVDMTAEAYDLAGNRSAVSDPFTLTIDFTAPARPVITRISDDTGSSATDGVTSDRNILVHGTAEAGVSVDVFSPGGKIGTVQADSNGDWMLDLSRFNLPQFTAVMTAEAFDLAGNRSAASDPFTLTIDFTAPAKPAITRISDDTGSSAADGVTSDRNILVHGTAEAGVSVDVFSPGGKIGTVQADANGDWMLDISRFNLPQFTANMTAEAIDLAGNRSASSDPFTLTIDFTGPDVTIDIANNSAIGYLITAIFGEEVSGLTLDGIMVAGGTASTLTQTSPTSYSFLVNSTGSSVDVTVKANAAEDLAGNGNKASNQLTLGFTAVSAREGFTDLQNIRKTEEISVYPNPANKVLTLDLSELSAEAVDIYMYDAAGVPVFKREAYRGRTLNVDVSGYTSGLYIVQCYDGSVIIRKKVMVKK